MRIKAFNHMWYLFEKAPSQIEFINEQRSSWKIDYALEKIEAAERYKKMLNSLTPCEAADRLENIVNKPPPATPRVIHSNYCVGACSGYSPYFYNEVAPCSSSSITGCGSCQRCRSGHNYTGVRDGGIDPLNVAVGAVIIGGIIH